jgi:hypothetical protein
VTWLVVAALAAIGLVAGVARSFALRRPFAGVPVVKVKDLGGPALAQVVGKVRILEASVRAPIRDHDVAWARVVARGQASAHAAAPAVRLHLDERWARVAIEDDTGRIEIDASRLSFELDPDRHEPREYLTNLIAPRESAEAWIRQAALEERRTEHGEPWPHIHLAEWVVDDGDPIAVIGVVREAGEGPFRASASVLAAERARLLVAKS